MRMMIKFGLGLAVVGLLLTVVKIGFDVRSIGDANDLAVFVGAAIAIGAARRQRRRQVGTWPPPKQTDRAG